MNSLASCDDPNDVQGGHGDPPIVRLPQVLFDDIFNMLNPVDLVKFVATGNRAIFGFVRRRMQPNIMAPFIGAVFVREGKYNRVASFHGGSEVLTRLAESASYVARSLSLLPKGHNII